jgi:hypothetical protein
MLITIIVFNRWIKSGHLVWLRHIPALDGISSLVSRAVESGQQIHVSLGTGGLTDTKTASTLAGLAVLDHLADQGCANGAPPLVTIADPIVLPAAQDSLRQAYTRHGRGNEYHPTQVEMVSPSPDAYALAASAHLHTDETAANLMVGSFGREVLLLSEPTDRRGIAQLAGTDNPEAMALLMAGTPDTLIGEEIFAVPAYLTGKAAHLASLRAQDVMRVGISIAILVAVILRTLNIGIF